ncbi:PLD-like domain-containing protein [Catalinimonas alkaloidigena]|uniref:phospholipase D n=1 Tax=Catalinimonas alkaloidigena TaxID=1075417 RepID=A0A1G9H5D7_9BACT|nr:phospholipase D-like domain-containing protein [Catalinimonas alkaloidigena]SDL07653.1 PLD-like domain-containing protein [Catalinimonas alkaloidigena]
MTHDALEASLARTFEDYLLSQEEKSALREALAPFRYDTATLNFARNRAFDLVEAHARTATFAPDALRWLEHVIKTIDTMRETATLPLADAHFSPGSACADRIIQLVEHTRLSLDICVFTISDDRISRALVEAHQRGIAVRIVTDNDKSNDRGSDVYHFAEEGLAVRIDTSPNHMHHKFAIFDQHTLVNGSFNWTRSASHYNQENITVLTDLNVLSAFRATFDRLWTDCVPLLS